MTGAQLTPRWTVADQWTGVVLAVVPAPGLPVPANELVAALAEAVRSDVIAFDLVTVGLTPALDGSVDRDDAAAAALLSLATAPGHFVAPRVVFGCAVMGGDAEQVDRAVQRLARHARLRRLNTAVFPRVVTGLEQGVAAIGTVVQQLLSAAERGSELGIDEARYLSEPVEQADTPAPPAEIEPPPGLAPEPGPAPAFEAASPIEVEPRTAKAPLVHRADRLSLRRPPLWQRVRHRLRRDGSVLTEPYWLDHLAATAGSAALVQVVFVPDYNPLTKAMTNRRRAVALALDDALGRVHRHPATGEDLNVAVEVVVATSPLTRSTTLRPAGVLSVDDLPTVPVEYFDVYDVVDGLVDAADRATGALTRRGIEVTGTQMAFLATSAPLYHDDAAEHFDTLVRHVARISWVHGGPGEMLSDDFGAAAPERVGRHHDHPDIVYEVLADAASLYDLPDPPFADPDDDPTA